MLELEGGCKEYKESFDYQSNRDWCELIKDIIAIANSGGGLIKIGINNSGEVVGCEWDITEHLDGAKIIDKIKNYTGNFIPEIKVMVEKQLDKSIAVLEIAKANTPIVFAKPGSYPIDGGKQKNAFSMGTVYFRHGAKSDPGYTQDLNDFIEKQVNTRIAKLMRNLKTVIELPEGHDIKIHAEVNQSANQSIRITDNPEAPAFRDVELEKVYPYRQKEVVAEFNKRTKCNPQIIAHDILVIRSFYKTDSNKKYTLRLKHSSRLFSDDFLDWLLSIFRKDHDIFKKARRKYSEEHNAKFSGKKTK